MKPHLLILALLAWLLCGRALAAKGYEITD